MVHLPPPPPRRRLYALYLFDRELFLCVFIYPGVEKNARTLYDEVSSSSFVDADWMNRRDQDFAFLLYVLVGLSIIYIHIGTKKLLLSPSKILVMCTFVLQNLRARLWTRDGRMSNL